MAESSRIDFQQQLILGIEYTVIGWYHFIYRNEAGHRTLAQLQDLVVFLWNAGFHPDVALEDLPEKSISETSMKSYRSRLSETFNISFDFQSRYVDFQTADDSIRQERLRMLTGYYLNARMRVFSDDALFLLLTNIRDETLAKSERTEGVLQDAAGRGAIPTEGLPPRAPGLLALYYIVIFQAAARLGLPLDVRYRHLMGRETSARRLLPLAVVNRSPYINLVARDKGDGRIKQFPISSIVSLQSDFWAEAYRAMLGEARDRTPFDYDVYKQDPEYRFLRALRRYRFRMMGYTFYHFCHSHRRDWSLVQEESSTSYVVDIVDDDWRGMLSLLFEYGKYIELVEEEELVESPESVQADRMPPECKDEPLPLLCAFRKRVEEIAQANPSL